MRRFFLLILFCLFARYNLSAQPNNPYSAYFKAQLHYGFIMQHRNTIGHLVNGHVIGGELDWALPTKGNKLWHYENNFPEAGLALHVYSLANHKQLGEIIAFAPYYDIGLKAKDSPSRLYLRLSTGVAYSTKKFDPITNHKNNVVSTTINSFINFKWYYKFTVSEKLRIDAGLNFSHISNAKFKAPNLGVNMLTLNAGLTYKITEKNQTSPTAIDSSTKAKSRHELYGLAVYGANETEPPGGPKFLAQSYILGYNYNVRNTHKFGGGIDVFYCQSVMENVYNSFGIRYANKAEYIQIGARASYSYNVGEFSFPFEFGCYLRNPDIEGGMFYHRIGVRYHLKNNIMLSFSLKSHWAVAQYFEFGAGYRLPLKKKR